MQMFCLVRDTDVSGVSGTGVVAEGCLFDNGHAAISWLGEYASTATWAPNELHNVLDKINHVHGHEGATRVVWLEASVDPRVFDGHWGTAVGRGMVAPDEARAET